MKSRIAIFASGNGSNAQSIIDYFQSHTHVEVALVVSDQPEAFVLQRAKKTNISTFVIPKNQTQNSVFLLQTLAKYSIDFIILAGYLRKIPTEICKKFENKILNIHPSLLPEFGGKGMFGIHVHQAVLQAKKKISGLTIHLVNEKYDEGKIIYQRLVKVETEHAEELQKKILTYEHSDYPVVIERVILNYKKNQMEKKIRTAFISVTVKDGLAPIIKKLHSLDIQIIASGGTAEFIKKLNIPVQEVADLTGFPSILDGRVKTLHPKVFGGILAIRDAENHQEDVKNHDIPLIDLVIVDLYPFEAALKSKQEPELIEYIDIGGVSLIRAAAKNFKDVVIVPSFEYYAALLTQLEKNNGNFTIDERRTWASAAFELTCTYDRLIFEHFQSTLNEPLRYGENPHQKAQFTGHLEQLMTQLHGKALSYNNLLDLDAAWRLAHDLHNESFFAIFKHTNPCGIAIDSDGLSCWNKALSCDPTSAFGGIIISNQKITLAIAQAIQEIFFEVLVSYEFEPEALELLKKKKNRIIIQAKTFELPEKTRRTALNGELIQAYDVSQDSEWKDVANTKFSEGLKKDAKLAELYCKHLKSNAIAIVQKGMLIGSGTGQTSRIDAVQQAIQKAKNHNFSLENAVLASDAFFPFSDSVQIGFESGIHYYIQPGGSLRDQESIDFCNTNGLAMIFTGLRHFRH